MSSSTDEPNYEEKILELCQEMPKGITDEVIQNVFPQMVAAVRVKIINKLLSQGRIDLLKNNNNQLIYRLKSSDVSSKVKGGDHQERMIYQIIEEAGNKGIWIRDIRFKSNMLLTQVNKILKNLEGKKLIKEVKLVNASKRKVYMLYDLEPDQSVTGGLWYTDQDFESEFVDILNLQCCKYLEQKAAALQDDSMEPLALRNASFASAQDILDYITKLGISKVALTMEHIETILDTLIYDGKVEMAVTASSKSSGQIKLYRAIKSVIPSSPLMSMPCGVCPVFSECHVGGAVSPTTCIYMNEWLNY